MTEGGETSRGQWFRGLFPPFAPLWSSTRWRGSCAAFVRTAHLQHSCQTVVPSKGCLGLWDYGFENAEHREVGRIGGQQASDTRAMQLGSSWNCRVRPSPDECVPSRVSGRFPYFFPFGSRFNLSCSSVTVEATPSLGTSTLAAQISALRTILRKFSSPQFLW